jgi:hypothetical protein
MNKKLYMTPLTEVMEMKTVGMLAASGPDYMGPGSGSADSRRLIRSTGVPIFDPTMPTDPTAEGLLGLPE